MGNIRSVHKRAVILAMGSWIVLATAASAAPALTSPTPSAQPCSTATPGCSPTPAAATVNFKGHLQKIDGFGVSTAGGAAHWFAGEPASARTRLLDLLFSTKSGAGLSMVRIEIGAGGSSAVPTIQPKRGKVNWTRTTLTRDGGQLLVLRGAHLLGVKEVLATAWSPPAWMKSNHAVDRGGHLVPSDYAAYAEYLATYVEGYPAHFGIPITAVSPANEPNVARTSASSAWNAGDLERFLADDLGPIFAKHHLAARVVIPEERTWKDDLAAPTLANPSAARAVSVIAAHAYNSSAARFADAAQAHKPVWQTQVSGAGTNDDSIADGLTWARNIDGYLSQGVSAWFWSQMVNQQSPATDAQGLVHLAKPFKSGDYLVAKRLWTIANFSRFIRPGWHMVRATHNPATGVDLTAFAAPSNGSFAVVAINGNTTSSSLKIALQSSKATTVTPYVTSSTSDLKAGSAVPVTHGAFTATLPPQSVTTFVRVITVARAAAAPVEVNALWYAGGGLLIIFNFFFWFTSRRWHMGVF